MYFDIKETYGKRTDLSKFFRSNIISISDFFPYLLEEGIPEIPCSASNKKKVFPLFKTVGEFEDFKIQLTNPIYDDGICGGFDNAFDYDFELYKEKFSAFKDILTDIGYEVEHRPVDELYDSFIFAQGVADVSGIVGLEPKKLLPTNKVPLAIPCTLYKKNIPNIESYYNNIICHTGNELSMTFYTLLQMHKAAFDDMGASFKEVEFYQDWFSHDFPTIKGRTDVITDICERIFGRHRFDPVMIKDIINNVISDREFVDYFGIMNSKFELREQDAKQLLVYHIDCIEKYDKHLKEEMDILNLSRHRMLHLIATKDDRGEGYRNATRAVRDNLY